MQRQNDGAYNIMNLCHLRSRHRKYPLSGGLQRARSALFAPRDWLPSAGWLPPHGWPGFLCAPGARLVSHALPVAGLGDQLVDRRLQSRSSSSRTTGSKSSAVVLGAAAISTVFCQAPGILLIDNRLHHQVVDPLARFASNFQTRPERLRPSMTRVSAWSIKTLNCCSTQPSKTDAPKPSPTASVNRPWCFGQARAADVLPPNNANGQPRRPAPSRSANSSVPAWHHPRRAKSRSAPGNQSTPSKIPS